MEGMPYRAMKNSIKQWLLFLIILCPFYGITQGLSFENYSVEEGLPSPEVYDIIQDDYGYLWFATDHGISRYNGYEFENFGLTDGITNNTVFKFFKLKNGEIWCNTFNHTLFSITGSKPLFTPFKYNHILTDTLTDKWIEHEVYVEESGAIYLSYTNHVGYVKVNSLGELTYNEMTRNLKKGFKIKLKIEDGAARFAYPTCGDESVEGFIVSPTIPGADLYTRSTYLEAHQTAIYAYFNGVIINGANGVKELKVESNPIAAGKFDEDHFWLGFRLKHVFQLK